MPSQIKGRKPPTKISHKYSRGVVAIVAGSDKFPGSAVLTVGGARRGGAGYVKYLDKSKVATSLVLNRFPDVVPIRDLNQEQINAAVIGPGAVTVKRLPPEIPLVIDGVAMSLLLQNSSGRSENQIIVVTPHEGELRFLGYEHSKERTVPLTQTQTQRAKLAQQVANELNVITVLKGHKTVIAAPNSKLILDNLGGAELAVAGSGDVLAGLIGAFLASWQPSTISRAQEVVAAAVNLHSRAGKHAANKLSNVLATDLLESLAEC